ncbi:cell differentiation [Sparganum proliferum]
MHPKKCNSRLFSTVCLSLLLLQLPLLQCRFVTTGTRARHIHLTSNTNTAERVSEGQKITLTCSDISTDRGIIRNNGGGDGGVLRILRKRSASSGGGSDGFEDMASVVSVDLVAPELRDITCTFEVSRLDDEAVFICGDAETLGFTMHMPTTATLTLRVQFNPRSLTLNSEPSDGMQEDFAKVIMCKTDEGGANPPANITWKHLSPLGAIEPLTNDMHHTQEVSQARRGGFVTRSNLTVTARRELNGHRIECAVESPERMLLFRQTETLEVFFAPNSVRIHPVPTGGVREGDWVQLTCAVSVSHPPATVRWFEFPASINDASTGGQEITDLAQIDMTPGEFGGMLVDSTLRVSKTFRTNSMTEYRCIVHQAALKAPVIAEYKLNILYPPTVEIISLPPDPKEAQSVTLSCLAHGGNPPEDMRFSWRYAKTLDLGAYPQSPSGNVDSVFAKTLVGALNASQMAALFSTMKREPGQLHRHLMLDSVDVNNMGWYGCEVNNAGGTAQTLHLLLMDFAPRIRAETKFIQHAEIGMPAELLLVVDTRPSRADVTWFWIEEGSSLANKARHKILAQRDAGDAYDSGVSRLSRSPTAAAGNTSPLKVVSTSSAPWLGRVRKSSLTVAPDRLKVSLSFREVIHSDFGIYMCQLNHKAGSREFYFELKPQSAARGIKPESVKISSDGRIARLEFEPPNSQFYSRIVLRICLAVKQLPALPGSAGTLRPLTGPAFLRPLDQLVEQPRRLQAGVDATGAASQENDASQSRVSGEGECTDYQVTFAELGYLQVEIERPISEYTFQFLVYMNSELKQVTRPVRWTRESKPVHAGPHKFFIQLIIGVLTTLIAVCLLVLLVYYICSLMKRRGHKKMTVDLINGVHPNLRPYQILEPSKPIVTLGTGQGSIGAESGSLQPLYPRQSIEGITVK